MTDRHSAADPQDPDAWEFWIDRGGTFTDILARTPDGAIRPLKLLSRSRDYADAASEGVRRLMGLDDGAAIPAERIRAVKMGTTVATNALLEEDGAPTLLVVDEGFADLLVIGDQTRPDIFALEVRRPAPLAAQTAEIAGRLDAEGGEIAPLDEAAARSLFARAREDGIRAVAVARLHAYAEPGHERRLEALAREAGFAHVTLSSEASPLIRLAPRASTAVIDAYLTPVLADYVARVRQGLGGAPLYFMQSSGGLAAADAFRARDAVLSGPAGGAVGMARTAQAAGFEKVIGFDMGGTSTDVSRAEGAAVERAGEARIAGRLLRAPMVAVHTVAAGGGSILAFDGERARVGPRSAGADPGPACYGRGGPATVTDANLVLGRIDPAGFPEVFGPDYDAPLDADAARARLAELAGPMGVDSPEAAAEGFLAVAVEAMAGAIKQITTARGVDPRDYAINAFGGAGGQHACKVAAALGVRTALIHPHAGLLSAYGIGLAPLVETREAGLEQPLDGGLERAEAALERLEAEARAAVARQAPGVEPSLARRLRLRAEGSDTALEVEAGGAAAVGARFAEAHERLFGFAAEDAPLVIESAAATAEADPPGAPAPAADLSPRAGEPGPERTTRLFDRGRWVEAPVHRLDALGAGARLQGPALILDANQTITLDPFWSAERRADGLLVLRAEEGEAGPRASTALDPVTLELFNQRFMAIAEEMGVVLERTAHSVNIKERLDFSCALFDADGGLVANAPHMPVHLGSMSASVRAALAAHPDLGPGDAVALNDPYNGGTHLPDVTVIAPVCDSSGERLFFTAARGHHADIGGVAPGSMPPFSRRIEEEGVRFDSVRIRSRGRFDAAAVEAVLAGGPCPARNPAQNLADLKAQLAACARGAQELERLIKEQGLDVVRAYMGHVQDNAERAVRRVIGALSDGAAQMRLDDGAVVQVAITVDREAGEAVIDFTGTSAQRDSNFNAPAAVTRAAVLYVLRCLVSDRIPLNEGCLKPITLIVPEGTLLNPRAPAAVVAGNVETSQIVVDALFAAAGRMAAAQGTMNNFTFGDASRQYYETICGGAGAGLDAEGRVFAGASAVHTHMTNSRLTDPEVMETRYPVRVIRHGVRTGSGGAGRAPGGDGSVRVIEFLEPMEAALLSGRRAERPPGLAGGGDGAAGAQSLIRADGSEEALPALFRVTVAPGDRIRIETPGGGGYGPAAGAAGGGGSDAER